MCALVAASLFATACDTEQAVEPTETSSETEPTERPVAEFDGDWRVVAAIDGSNLPVETDPVLLVIQGGVAEFPGAVGRCVGASGPLEVRGEQLVWADGATRGSEECDPTPEVAKLVRDLVWSETVFRVDGTALLLEDTSRSVRFERDD